MGSGTCGVEGSLGCLHAEHVFILSCMWHVKRAVIVSGTCRVGDIHLGACMQSMFQRLHVDAHLKHNGRLQLGLFLKVTGLPAGDWRLCD